MTAPNRILVTGSRTWRDERVIREALSDAFRQRPDGDSSVTVVHGGARGADKMASRWVRDFSCVGNPIGEVVYHANWHMYGRRAGILRNQQMVNDGAYICLAFIRDGSRGASHCALAAEAAGYPDEDLPGDVMSADLLRRAAKALKQHVAELPVRIQDDWTQDSSEIVTAAGYDVGQMIHGEGAEVAYYVILMHPPVALALAACMDEVAWLGEKDADLLHRVGHPELIAVARAILREAS